MPLEREPVPHNWHICQWTLFFSAANNAVSKRKDGAAMQRYLPLSIAVMLSLIAGAQQNPPSTSPPTSGSPPTSSATDVSPAKSLGMYAYPKNDQGSDQQL